MSKFKEREAIKVIDCKRFAELLDSYIDGDISQADKISCHVHISECASCKAEYEFAKRIHDTLHTLPAPEVPAGFLDDINKKIDEGAFRDTEPRIRRIVRNPAAYSAVAAGLALAVVVGSGPWRLLRDTEKEPVHVDLPVTDTRKGTADKEKQDTLPAPKTAQDVPSVPEVTQAPAPPAVSVQPSAPQRQPSAPPSAERAANTMRKTADRPVSVTPAPAKKTQAPAKATAAPVLQPEEDKQLAVIPQATENATAEAKPTPEAKQVPADNEIAIPSDNYRVSDESDAANVAKIEHNRKLQESYALVESVDNMVYSPDVQQRLEDNGNIVVNDAVYVQAIQGDTNALSSSVMVSREDMDAVNRALEVFNFPSSDRCYFMTGEQLRQFLNTLDNLGVEYRHNAVNEGNQVVLKLITT